MELPPRGRWVIDIDDHVPSYEAIDASIRQGKCTAGKQVRRDTVLQARGPGFRIGDGQKFSIDVKSVQMTLGADLSSELDHRIAGAAAEVGDHLAGFDPRRGEEVSRLRIPTEHRLVARHALGIDLEPVALKTFLAPHGRTSALWLVLNRSLLVIETVAKTW